jgi:hypothetical protein
MNFEDFWMNETGPSHFAGLPTPKDLAQAAWDRAAALAHANYMPLMDTALAIRFDALDEAQAMKNHGQALDRLRQRGGLGLSEAAAVKDKRKWRAMTATEALCALATPNEAVEKVHS